MAKKNLQLGRPIPLPASPENAKLDAVPNPHKDSDYMVRFTAPEFTTLCPITGQPDFAHFVIDYVPAASILEFKSLKLFLASFRNIGGFHEDCTLKIGKRIQGCNQAQIYSRVRILVSAWGNADRHLLADWQAPTGCVAA